MKLFNTSFHLNWNAPNLEIKGQGGIPNAIRDSFNLPENGKALEKSIPTKTFFRLGNFSLTSNKSTQGKLIDAKIDEWAAKTKLKPSDYPHLHSMEVDSKVAAIKRTWRGESQELQLEVLSMDELPPIPPTLIDLKISDCKELERIDCSGLTGLQVLKVISCEKFDHTNGIRGVDRSKVAVTEIEYDQTPIPQPRPSAVSATAPVVRMPRREYIPVQASPGLNGVPEQPSVPGSRGRGGLQRVDTLPPYQRVADVHAEGVLPSYHSNQQVPNIIESIRARRDFLSQQRDYLSPTNPQRRALDGQIEELTEQISAHAAAEFDWDALRDSEREFERRIQQEEQGGRQPFLTATAIAERAANRSTPNNNDFVASPVMPNGVTPVLTRPNVQTGIGENLSPSEALAVRISELGIQMNQQEELRFAVEGIVTGEELNEYVVELNRLRNERNTAQQELDEITPQRANDSRTRRGPMDALLANGNGNPNPNYRFPAGGRAGVNPAPVSQFAGVGPQASFQAAGRLQPQSRPTSPASPHF